MSDLEKMAETLAESLRGSVRWCRSMPSLNTIQYENLCISVCMTGGGNLEIIAHGVSIVINSDSVVGKPIKAAIMEREKELDDVDCKTICDAVAALGKST